MSQCNYVSRSNEFEVTDVEYVKKCLKFYRIDVIQNKDNPNRITMLRQYDDSWWNIESIDQPIQNLTVQLAALVDVDHCDDDPNITELPCIDEWIWKYLKEGEVIILQEIGNEKMRYLIGSSMAINHEGKNLQVDITDIYEKVQKEWGIDPSRCEY